MPWGIMVGETGGSHGVGCAIPMVIHCKEEWGSHSAVSNGCLRLSTGSVRPCFQSLHICQKRKTAARRSGRNAKARGLPSAALGVVG
jgi:hypothetical protein